jgi:pyruvate dehydrogenase E1 component
MEGLFRQLGIYNAEGQRYEPEDREQVMYYKESTDGQILQEGINEAGAFGSWVAAATAYTNHQVTLIPFYIYYSMFGFQRIGDMAWMAGDQRARGFLIGGTSGRTTLNGEGLQHEDGHSHVQAGLIPNCKTYDPAFAYELAVIIGHGLKEMVEDHQDVYYYITTMNENYAHPAMPEGAEDGIVKGLYAFKRAQKPAPLHVQLLGSGTIFNEVIAAATLLAQDHGVSSDIWGLTSANELYRDAMDAKRWERMHPGEQGRLSHLNECLNSTTGPIIAATDYVKIYTEQLREFMPRRYETLGTDGYGRSDTREQLRAHFEVDRYFITVTALKALADEGAISYDVVKAAMNQYGIDPNKANPLKV